MTLAVDILAEAPLLLVTLPLCLVLGLLEKTSVPSPLVMASLGALISAGIICLICERWDRGRSVVALAVIFLTFISVFISIRRIDSFSYLSGHVRAEGSVVYERSWGGKRAMVLSSSSGKLLAMVAPMNSHPEGTGLVLDGYAVPLRKGRGDFDPRKYWLARGISAEVIPESIKLCPESDGPVGSFRTFLRRRILLTLPPLTRGYLLASLLGVKDPDLAEMHREWGTSHLLAVSGFHVGLVALFLSFVFRKIRFRWIIVSIFLWVYVLMAGAAPSACRAALMIQTAIAALWVGRPASIVNSVAIAATALLLWNPWWFWDLGWRLSVLCAFSIAMFVTTDRISPIVRGSMISPLLWVVTAPLITKAFTEVPLSGLLLNLIALPAFALLLPVAILCSLPCLMGMPLGGYIAQFPEGLFMFWNFIADKLAFLPFIGWSLWLPLVSLGALSVMFALRFRIKPLKCWVAFFTVIVFYVLLT